MSTLVKKIISVLGIVAGAFLIMVSVICVEEWFRDPAYAADMEISGLVMCVILGIAGVLLVITGIHTICLLREFREYKNAVENSKDGFIPEIASVLGKPEDKVRRNLDKMCKKKYFGEAYVDNKANLFISGKKTSHKIGNPSFSKEEVSKACFVTVRCKSCGGVNKIPKGAVGECEYCGSPVRGE